MSEWKEYTGSDEQIAEMYGAPHGWIVEYIDTDEPVCPAISQICFLAPQDTEVIRKYLICNPHPLADMICQQARTGQPVWIRTIHDEFLYGYKYFNYPPTITPDWNIPNAEYSFAEFKEEV